MSDALTMKPKIVGRDKDYIISPNLFRGWEAPDKSVGDNAHNSLRAVLERATDRYAACDSPLAGGSQPLQSLSNQMMKMGQTLLRGLLWDGRLGAAASSSDAPPPPGLDHPFEDTAVADSETGPVERFNEQLDELGAKSAWDNLDNHDKERVLATAIEWNTQKAEGDDRGATEGDARDPDDRGSDHDPEATNQPHK